MKTEPEQKIIQFGGQIIPFTLQRAKRKNLRLVVNPDLSVAVYAPQKAATKDIMAAVHKKAHWLKKTLDKVQSYHPLPSPKQYISGETFLYLGRQYRLKVCEGERASAKLIGRFLHVAVNSKNNRDAIKNQINKWYREHATKVFERYLSTCLDVASRHGIPPPKLSIRIMKRRWGSCSASRRITLNTLLVQAPVHCIEYVIMHELCHLQQHNHSPAFYRLLTQCLPDWKNRKETLDRFRLTEDPK